VRRWERHFTRESTLPVRTANCSLESYESTSFAAVGSWHKSTWTPVFGSEGEPVPDIALAGGWPALDRLMAVAARREVRLRPGVWRIDGFGRSVQHLSQQLPSLSSFGVRFMAVSQAIDTDTANPSARLLLTILAGVAEFEREIIRERTLSGVHAARAAGKVLGRPQRVFRRDEVIRLRDERGLELARDREATRSSGIDRCGCVQVYGNRPFERARVGSENKPWTRGRLTVRKTILVHLGGGRFVLRHRRINFDGTKQSPVWAGCSGAGS
jgi:Resolvase, N terminal domain